MSARGNEHIVARSKDANPGVSCPKCGSSRTNVTVNIVDDTDQLTLYSCTCCDHRFSRSYR